MDHIRHVLPGVLRSRGLQDQVLASLIVFKAEQWIQRTVPAPLAEALHAHTYAQGVLTVQARTSVASQELRERTEKLRQHIENECGVAVAEVRIVRR